jgi:hypothetical protein
MCALPLPMHLLLVMVMVTHHTLVCGTSSQMAPGWLPRSWQCCLACRPTSESWRRVPSIRLTGQHCSLWTPSRAREQQQGWDSSRPTCLGRRQPAAAIGRLLAVMLWQWVASRRTRTLQGRVQPPLRKSSSSSSSSSSRAGSSPAHRPWQAMRLTTGAGRMKAR